MEQKLTQEQIANIKGAMRKALEKKTGKTESEIQEASRRLREQLKGGASNG